MSEHTSAIEAPRERLFTFSSGGWHVLAAIVILIFVTVVTVAPVVKSIRNRPPGDGQNPSAYGFALSPSLIPEEDLRAAMHHRDFTDPLNEPEVFGGLDVAKWNNDNRGKYLVTTDPVVGVIVNGSPRAYPLSVLRSHEVINDIVAGTPILVMYNPLCRSVTVFDRTIDGAVREFGVSGLVYQSNLLIFDRSGLPEPGGESLWSQIQARAVTGPAAARGDTLDVLPCQVMHWADWLARHQDTTVIAPIELYRERWKKTSYDGYFANDVLNFPVEPRPADVIAAKRQVLAVETASGWETFPFAQIEAEVDARGAWATTIDGRPVVIQYRSDPAVAWIETDGVLPPVMYSAEFAWTALRQ